MRDDFEPSLEPWYVSHHELVVTRAMHTAPAWRAGVLMVIGVIVLAMLASEPLLTWANRLPAHPLAELVVAFAQGWNRAMQAIGLTEIFQALRGFFTALRG